MNREIKFRGKCKGGRNCSWVYGYYVYNNHVKKHFIYAEEYFSGDYGLVEYEVYSESVGQYLGVKDKLGKEIFEGDIIRLKRRKSNSFISFTPSNHDYLFNYAYPFVVSWCCGEVIFKQHGKQKFISKLTGKKIDIEVVGNIFENPEQLNNPKYS